MTFSASPRFRASCVAASTSTLPMPPPHKSGSTNRPSSSPPTTAAKPTSFPSISATITWPLATCAGGRYIASGLASSSSRYSGSSREARRCSSSSSPRSSGLASRSVRLSARFDIRSRRVLDRLELPLPGHARAVGPHRLRILLLQPLKPIRPPAPFVLDGAFDELVESVGRAVVDPILVLVRRGRVHDARDVP